MNLRPTTRPQKLRLLGVVIFILSFIPPGINAFWLTLESIALNFTAALTYGVWQSAILGLALTIGGLANFTIFFRLPRIAAMFAIASPWILFFGMMFLSYNRGVEAPWPDIWVVTFIPFYPWAIGIGLIHLSRLMEPNVKDHPRTSWTGF
jgi:hypothetical protein